MPPRQLQLVVADDDRDTLLTLALILRDEGHKVHPAHRSAAVLPLVLSARPDAVILDIAMPGQSGYALAQDIQAAYSAARKPLLIAVTGEYKRPSDRLLSQLVGFDHYLLKPYAPGELLGLLQPLSLPPAPRAAT
jgi:DNA-binding response OmpR family regulator